jgi:hypothetical protein
VFRETGVPANFIQLFNFSRLTPCLACFYFPKKETLNSLGLSQVADALSHEKKSDKESVNFT